MLVVQVNGNFDLMMSVIHCCDRLRLTYVVVVAVVVAVAAAVVVNCCQQCKSIISVINCWRRFWLTNKHANVRSIPVHILGLHCYNKVLVVIP